MKHDVFTCLLYTRARVYKFEMLVEFGNDFVWEKRHSSKGSRSTRISHQNGISM